MLALGVAGMASATTLESNVGQNVSEINKSELISNKNESSISQHKLESKMTYFQGWCEVKIFRRNADGSSTLVAYSLTIVDSQDACQAKYAAMMFEQQVKEFSAGIN